MPVANMQVTNWFDVARSCSQLETSAMIIDSPSGNSPDSPRAADASIVDIMHAIVIDTEQ